MEILVVENDPGVVTPITEGIERCGHHCESSGTGEDALKMVSQKKFDLILLDIFLPDCEGHELIPRFKETWPDIGVVTMTGYNTRELEWQVRQKGIIYYMIKPFSMKEMKDILDHISKKRERR